MRSCDEVRARLSAFVDGETAADAAAVREHIETCEACRGVADDLARLRDAARALGPVTPPAAAWSRLAEQVERESAAATSTRVPAAAVRQWIGLAAALVLITLGLYAMDRLTTGDAPAGNVIAGPSVEGVNEELNMALDHYENAITQLRQLAVTGSESLDPEVAATFDRNMAIVDSAITESRAALEADPTNQPARASLLEALSQKVNVLQATVLLINEMRQGDAAGAAEAAGTGGRSS